MSDSTSPSVEITPRRFGFDALVTGLSLGACVVFAMLWWQARQHVVDLQEGMVPLREETERYRAGLREEVQRTHKLTEELKAAQNKTAAAR